MAGDPETAWQHFSNALRKYVDWRSGKLGPNDSPPAVEDHETKFDAYLTAKEVERPQPYDQLVKNMAVMKEPGPIPGGKKPGD